MHMNSPLLTACTVSVNQNIEVSSEEPDGGVFAPQPTPPTPTELAAQLPKGNKFRPFVARGFPPEVLLPVIPPGADISPTSSLAMPERQKAIGKTPGIP